MTRTFFTIILLIFVGLSFIVFVPQTKTILTSLKNTFINAREAIITKTKEVPFVKEITDTIPAQKDPIQTPGALNVEGELSTQKLPFSAQSVVTETNKRRTTNSKKALTTNARLNASAQYKAEDMLTRHYFEHVGPNNETISVIITKEGYEYITIGENLAMGGFISARDLVDAWMNSPGHKANILNDRYTEIGIGLAVGNYNGRSVLMAVQHFGLPKSACPTIDDSLRIESDERQAELKTLEVTINKLREKIESDGEKGASNKEDIDTYNALVADYNQKVREIEAIIKTYNAQVREFNTCASAT